MEIIHKTEYTYNNDGNKIEKINFKNRENITSKTVYTYNSAGCLIGSTILDVSCQKKYKHMMLYDFNSRLSGIKVFSFNGQLIQSITYKYNKNCVSEILHKCFDITEKFIYKYNDSENRTEEKRYIIFENSEKEARLLTQIGLWQYEYFS